MCSLVFSAACYGERDRNVVCLYLLGCWGLWDPQTSPLRFLQLTVRYAYIEDVWGSTDLSTIL